MEFITCLNYAIGIQEVRQAVGLFVVASAPTAMILYAFLVNIYRKKQSSLDEFESLANEYSSIMEENASKLKELRIAVEENGKALSRLVDVYRKPAHILQIKHHEGFVPSQELLDAGEAEGSKRFTELYIKTMEKQLARKPNP